MSGSGGNAFLDLLRAVAPASVPPWILALLAAALAFLGVLCVLAVAGGITRAWERKIGAAGSGTPAAASRAGLANSLAAAGAFGALAAVPIAPHVFFADPGLGFVLVVALLAVSTAGRVLESAAGGVVGGPTALRAIAGWCLPALALLGALLAAGTPNLIAASRTQTGACGMAWAAFENPFVLLALAVYLVASARDAAGRGEGEPWLSAGRARSLAWSSLAAVYFLGGFESPLTWWLRQSLGEDPGFVNHVAQADGSTALRIAIAGLAFQVVAAATLFAKSLLLTAAAAWLGSAKLRPALARARDIDWARGVALSGACVAGAGLWEWARVVLGGGA